MIVREKLEITNSYRPYIRSRCNRRRCRMERVTIRGDSFTKTAKREARECKRRSQGKGKSAIQIEKTKTRHGACARPTTRGTGRSNTGITTLFDLMLAYACSCTGACTHYETLAWEGRFYAYTCRSRSVWSNETRPATSRWSLVTRDFGRAFDHFLAAALGGV
ncbi:hypothetical protein CI102_11272 [Trichoderma harzianum]|uniref:Uncharacterized protein n=1 Tax=Trichoderma harzianum CBS 226.95 TaxID=983964 RepID=A0A2T3ZZA4_TRIHA|nr:hypothetical protein M431DRAFT_260129 [Trichoderma harzianum CBS 226.95]PKK44237.1 hypothetical protein CI102_11272 [Trichoderma harzianum]PTB50073.1 hypothetical protein M431DRAFT_260129 [Trichoderma harzianum CBS 226.95]